MSTFGVHYTQQMGGTRGYGISNQSDFAINPEDEIDYSFNKLSVRERRKLFMNDLTPPKIYQYETLPRAQGPRNSRRFDSQSEMGEWNPPIRRSWAPKAQTTPRPSSTYGAQTVSHRTLTLRHTDPQFNQNITPEVVTQDFIQPSYAAPRQSRPLYRPQVSTTVRVGGEAQQQQQQRNYTAPGTRVFSSRRQSYSMAPRERESASMGREVWPTRQTTSFVGQPLRVHVYNSDRSMASPTHAPSVPNWGPTSPIYPAYPAYAPRPIEGHTQSPTRSYQKGFEPRLHPSPSAAPVYVALSPRERRPASDQRFQQQQQQQQQQHKSVTIYPSGAPRSPPVRPQRDQQDWTQPVRVAPVLAAAPPPLRGQQQSPQFRTQPRVQTRRPIINRHSPLPPPDDEKGVSEF